MYTKSTSILLWNWNQTNGMRKFHIISSTLICALIIIFTAGCSQISSPPSSVSVNTQEESIVGKWYAPSPDKLTFQFNADGTFTESGQFGTYHGKWVKIATNMYDAEIRDGWGVQKQAHFRYNNGQLLTGGIMPLHKI